MQEDPLFQQFIILVSVEGLENKYSLELNRGEFGSYGTSRSCWKQLMEFVSCVCADWKVLKNRKFLGSVSEQNIRTKSRPVIQELQPEYVHCATD